jgi:hypothetical protein
VGGAIVGGAIVGGAIVGVVAIVGGAIVGAWAALVILTLVGVRVVDGEVVGVGDAEVEVEEVIGASSGEVYAGRSVGKAVVVVGVAVGGKIRKKVVGP